MPSVQPIPDGYLAVTAYLIFKNTSAAIDWYTRVFGAQEIMRMAGPGGSVMHAEIQVGNARLMMADENTMMGNRSAETLGGSPVGFMFYVPDVDSVFRKAIEAGARQKRPVENQFYGDRSGTLTDPFGMQWTIGTHIEDVAPEEMDRRMASMRATA